MDVLLLLKIVIALSLYPGGLFFCLVVTVIRALAQVRGGTRLQLAQVLALGICAVAAGLLPLPGSPLFDPVAALPLSALLVCVAAGLGLGLHSVWSRSSLIAAVVLLTALALLAVVATSPSLFTLVTVPGARARGGRDLIALALLLAAPLLAAVDKESFAATLRIGAFALIALFALSLLWSDLGIESIASQNFPWLVLGGFLYCALAPKIFARAWLDDVTLATAAAIPAAGAIVLLLLA